jgi:hypothetical protein
MAAADSVSPARTFTATGGNDDFRRLVLNALVWIAKSDVPAGGVPSTVTAEELTKNLDPKTR